ncbi:MAG TPA: OmpA family protein [Polyangiaceae bacterium]|nr:OmpA family protein [Polyangiaceae bacterium]
MIHLRTHRRVYGFPVGALALVAGCTTTQVVRPPPELAEARAAYGTAATGPAAQYAPGDLHEAKRTLDRAEALDRAQPASPAAHGQAYVALRRVEIAEANAGILVAQAQREEASLAAMDAQARRMAATDAELARTRQELAQERCGQPERQGGQEGQCARHGRADVIVIPGAALFATGSAEISAAARANLNEIAQTLKREHNRRVRVEGFTDATGTHEVNTPLSEQRADAVRTYLVSCGVDASRMQTVGLGSSQRIGDEATADGRAANRRVRIVIEPSTGVAEPMR